jgi:hypothetical protein
MIGVTISLLQTEKLIMFNFSRTEYFAVNRQATDSASPLPHIRVENKNFIIYYFCTIQRI